jgi:hypothetical protein
MRKFFSDNDVIKSFAKIASPGGLQNSGVKIFSPGRVRPVLLPTADIALIVTC